jgi:hypothetical protein
MLILTAQAQNRDDVPQPTVFQAAGPNATSIQSSVDQFRAALGANNGVTAPPQPLTAGRREINWDGGNPANTATTLSPTPLDAFLVGRGARFTTPGAGFVQAPATGLADLFGNPSYANIFKPFSPLRLFSPLDSNVTDTLFFVPGGGEVKATTRGFGVVYGRRPSGREATPAPMGKRHASTRIEFFSADGEDYSALRARITRNGNLTFFGIVFDDPRIARVRSQPVRPGPDDSRKRDVVMMDDFIYGEPQAIH